MQHHSQKYVVAHFMPYTVQDWIADIRLASSHDLDGFALNVGVEDWQLDRVVDCYAAALELRTTFKLFSQFRHGVRLSHLIDGTPVKILSLEARSIPAQKPEDVHRLCRYVELLARHPNQMLYEGKVLVSTFAGDQARFGYPSIDEAWAFATTELSKFAPIHFIPAFFVDPATYPKLSSIDGIFHWNGGWPIHLTLNSSPEEIRYPALDTDKIPYVSSGTENVHGCSLTVVLHTDQHYGPNSWNKNWTYRNDDWLLVRRWEYLLSQRNRVDVVQLISWNDYGESHYVAPVRGAQPNSQAWVDGFPHEPWLILNAYYARAFKQGVRMPPIEKDRIFMWARPHPKAAHALKDQVPRPDGWQLTDDLFWVVVFATDMATVATSSGEELPVVYKVNRGVTKLAGKLTPGGGMRAQMSRNGIIIAECAPSLEAYKFEARPQVYNFNAYVAMSE